MSDFDPYSPFFGTWSGRKELHLDPSAEPAISDVSLWAESGAGGAALLIEYDWTYEGDPVGGTLLVVVDDERAASAGFSDSFHSSSSVMHFKGKCEDDGRIVLNGTYPAGEGPDWGWRIELHPPEGDEMKLVMFNLMPVEGGEMEEMLAVKMDLTRADDEEAG